MYIWVAMLHSGLGETHIIVDINASAGADHCIDSYCTGGIVSEEDLQGTNPLAMLLRSMLPWINAGQAPDYEGDGDAPNGDAPNGDHQAGH